MPGGKLVTAPDGTRWRVRRRWLNRPAPKPWTRWRRKGRRMDDGSEAAGWGLDALMGADSIAGLVAVVAAIAALVLLVIALLLLLGVVFELALFAFVVGSGLFGRVVLRRPWTIEAVNVDDPGRRHAFA
ncbi:MAG TPA: hypothetical protein VFS37_15340, partial [Conexibacter sp.]|nr:hypothetical protein [Conexibacter sp.]